MSLVSITKPESRIIMSDTSPPSVNSSTFDFVTTEFPGLFGPERSTPGEKTFLPTQQQTKCPDVGNATGHSYYKGYFSPESFGSYQDVMDTLRLPVSSYSLLYEHPKVHKPIPGLETKVHKQVPGRKRKLQSTKNNKAIVKATPKCKPVSNKIGGENKKFPKNVKSLMATRMFDGVPVKYFSVSVGVVIHGIIEGNVYLCGCSSCNYKNKVSASEFERHALCGDKTSHSNNHILFENGKTMHEVVKELQSMPGNMLFVALHTVTGSPINEEAFCAWKEKYLASQQVVSPGVTGQNMIGDVI